MRLNADELDRLDALAAKMSPPLPLAGLPEEATLAMLLEYRRARLARG